MFSLQSVWQPEHCFFRRQPHHSSLMANPVWLWAGDRVWNRHCDNYSPKNHRWSPPKVEEGSRVESTSKIAPDQIQPLLDLNQPLLRMLVQQMNPMLLLL